MALRNLLYVLIIVCICNCRIIKARADGEFQKDIDLERRLKLRNKPAVKTIELDYGIFDCVDMYKQPAFDHPLLKNHKIQMEPTHFPSRFDEKDSLKVDSNEFGVSIDCPIGTVPIRRTTKENLIREEASGSIHVYHPTDGQNDANVHFAVMGVQQNEPYLITGAKAIIGTFNPQLNPGEYSGAQVWISETSDDGTTSDSISVGWMVSPDLYGNSNTYFTASWKSKNGSGCYNLLCPGFVQVPSPIPLGSVVSSISGNGTSYGMVIWIFQDKASGWWLYSAANYQPIGYWPKELFSSFNDGAKTLTYGGVVKANPNQPSPPMGSGFYEKCDNTADGFFERLSYQINDDVLKGDYIPPRLTDTILHSDCPNYHVSYMCNEVKDWNFYFLYGGPRGNC